MQIIHTRARSNVHENISELTVRSHQISSQRNVCRYVPYYQTEGRPFDIQWNLSKADTIGTIK